MNPVDNHPQRLTLIVLFFLSLLTMSACQGEEKMSDQLVSSSSSSALEDISNNAWNNLSSQRILFGHQSVGYNIITGVEDLKETHPQINLRIIDNKQPWELTTPGLIHFQVGNNTQPLTKIEEFSRIIRTTAQQQNIDIAFFKFCYVDIRSDSNVEEVFRQYKNMMDELSQTFPDITFVVATVPLTQEEIGIRPWLREVKKSLSQLVKNSPATPPANWQRKQFNELLRKEYEGKMPIFDLAQIESTLPDGSRHIAVKNGQEYFSLVPDYTDDGGHLNEIGRRVVAEKLLIFLTQLQKL
jgi:hypothetical protein